MFNYTYDDIYGISLDEYLARHGVTIDDLINKIKMDIAILKENQARVYENKLPYPESYLETIMYEAIKKKEKHLEDLLTWQNEGEYGD